MDITPPRDSTGTESLKRSNERTEVRETEQIAPARPIPPSGEWHGQDEGRPAGGHRQGPNEPGRPEVERRSGAERRQADRRQGGREVLFDAREPHERRVTIRRREDRERQDPANARPVAHGIDVKA